MLRKAITVFIPVAAIVALCVFFSIYSPTGGLFRKTRRAGTATILRQERSLGLSLPLLLPAFACLGLEGWLANPPPLKPRAATVP